MSTNALQDLLTPSAERANILAQEFDRRSQEIAQLRAQLHRAEGDLNAAVVRAQANEVRAIMAERERIALADMFRAYMVYQGASPLDAALAVQATIDNATPLLREEPAICNRCQAPKGAQAIGESCNNNCGGKVVAR